MTKLPDNIQQHALELFGPDFDLNDPFSEQLIRLAFTLDGLDDDTE